MSKTKEPVTTLLCPNHTEYHVPLIMTFKFRGQEFWCPYCGYTCGMFGSYVEVVQDKELREREKKFKKLAKEFLSSDGMIFKYEQKP